jgi:5-methylthioadenosine/S-adenosylhomocysteine deaminase
MIRRMVLGGGLLSHPASRLEMDWGVVIEGGTIVAMGPNAVLSANPGGAETIDARDLILCPGLVNGHMHAYGLLTHGIPMESVPSGFDRFLLDFWWPRVEDRLDARMIEAATDLACVRMIQSGITTFCDVLEAPKAPDGILDRVAGVVEAAGLRATLCMEASERCGRPTGERALSENERFARATSSDRRIRGMQCIHTSFTCSESFVRAAKESSIRAGCAIHLHLSESDYEPTEALRLHGVRPVLWYDRLGFLDSTVLASQAVAVDDEEIDRLAERGVRVVHMPLSNCEVGGGIAPIPRMIERGLTPGLGTDGYINDPFEVMRGAFLIHKGARADAAVMPARTVWAMATTWGAHAVDWGDVGTLEVGRPADLIGIDARTDTPLTAENGVDQLLLFRSGADVRLSIVDGRILLRDGILQGTDEGAIRERAVAEALRLWKGRGDD